MRPRCVVIDRVCVRFRFSGISVLIVNRNYCSFATIYIKFMLSLTPVLSELAICGSAIHIQILVLARRNNQPNHLLYLIISVTKLIISLSFNISFDSDFSQLSIENLILDQFWFNSGSGRSLSMCMHVTCAVCVHA